MTGRRIIDNQTGTVAEYLERALTNADDFSFVSAYFTIYGYELLADQLNRVGNTRFLFGDPASVEELDPSEDEPKSFELTEHGLVPNHVLHQKALAKQCAEWVSKDNVAVRSVSRSNFLHGKMYLAGSSHGPTGVVGSSNFTKRGLGGSDQPNLEINLTTEDLDTVTELSTWFNTLWSDDQRTEDVKQQVLAALERIGRDYAPEAVYYKTLYELFRRDIEARQAGDDPATPGGFQDSQVWNVLYEFQKDGAKSVIAKLREHNGCILADSVGLGKTYTALAVIKYFELRNERVLVLCPKKLWQNWSLYQVGNNHIQNPFPEDRFAYTLLAHTDLSRDSGMSGNVDLANLNWRNYDLVVIDESHNFRNDGGNRYKRLLDEVIKEGSKTKVLMLSATPVNTSLLDLRNQIYLMTETEGREEAFENSLGVRSIRNTMAAAQREFKAWETGQSPNGKRNKAQLLESLGPDFLRLLDGVSISRSRRQIEQFYDSEMERIGKFPERASPVNKYPRTDLERQLSYQGIADRIGEFKLAVYQPSEYVIDTTRLKELTRRLEKQNFNQRDSERFLVGMMRTNFLKRLESSAHALTLTLKRTISKIDALLDSIDRYEQNGQLPATPLSEADVSPDDDDEDEEFFVNRGRNPYRLRELDLPRWRADLNKDKAMLSDVLSQVQVVTPERDGKLKQIEQAIRGKVDSPTHNHDSRPNRKLLVFTTFKDTANYLYTNLTALAAELNFNMAMVSGDETHTTVGVNDFNTILSNFAPEARNRSPDSTTADIDLLIATDCISEGQNLQDCDTVLNYDIHWNPVRLVQRFGRIDRIGSRNPTVQMINFWPTEDMDAYLRLQHRVHARMTLADLSASGDEDLLGDQDRFTEDDARQELRFRDEQLLKLRDEVPNLDDLDDGPVMGDFTLDYFLTQLLRYLEANKDALEAMPSGVYAVAASDANARPGVIFCLRQRNAGDVGGGRRAASPVHPFYLVYLHDNGSIRYGCANAQQALAVFDAATVGKTTPIIELCDQFDRETDRGRDMSFYDILLTDAIAHIGQAHNTAQTRGLGLSGRRDFLLPKASEAPNDTDFELVAWLVIMDTK